MVQKIPLAVPELFFLSSCEMGLQTVNGNLQGKESSKQTFKSEGDTLILRPVCECGRTPLDVNEGGLNGPLLITVIDDDLMES